MKTVQSEGDNQIGQWTGKCYINLEIITNYKLNT